MLWSPHAQLPGHDVRRLEAPSEDSDRSGSVGQQRGRTVSLVARTRDHDACPGALQVHQAADGALARVRLPGGMITRRTARGAGTRRDGVRLPGDGTHLARQHADPRHHRTARVAEAIAAAGLLPSQTHERVRNIVASPLSGRVGTHDRHPRTGHRAGRRDQAEPELADLPGRFLFGIDDGSGDISGLGADVGVHCSTMTAALLLAGRDTGVRLAMARRRSRAGRRRGRFAEIRGKAWRIGELD